MKEGDFLRIVSGRIILRYETKSMQDVAGIPGEMPSGVSPSLSPDTGWLSE
jgi:hypothetical protein